LDWLAKHDYSLMGINEPLKGVVSLDNQDIENKNPYTKDDLRKLFNSHEYINCRHNESYKYWVPLIGLLTGARENEICQLHLSDIYLYPDTNIWVIDINESDRDVTYKSLKRPYHKRLIPMHPLLFKLGLVEFCEYRKKQGEKRLFPELTYSRDRNKYATKFCKWFNTTYTNAVNCNITTTKTSFHSLRHNLINYFSHKLELSENKFAYVVGQKPFGNVAVSTYIKPSELEVFNTWYKKLNYSDAIDFAQIGNWKRNPFYRNSRK
jgi:integrase